MDNYQQAYLDFKTAVDDLIRQAEVAKKAGYAVGFKAGSMLNERRALRIQEMLEHLKIMRDSMNKNTVL